MVFEPPHAGGVAYMAHIGGYTFGVLAGIFARWLPVVNEVRYADGTSPRKDRKRPGRWSSQRQRLSQVLSWCKVRIQRLTPARWQQEGKPMGKRRSFFRLWRKAEKATAIYLNEPEGKGPA